MQQENSRNFRFHDMFFLRYFKGNVEETRIISVFFRLILLEGGERGKVKGSHRPIGWKFDEFFGHFEEMKTIVPNVSLSIDGHALEEKKQVEILTSKEMLGKGSLLKPNPKLMGTTAHKMGPNARSSCKWSEKYNPYINGLN